MNRKPNTSCIICSKKIYRRPFELIKNKERVFCSKTCYGKSIQKIKTCPICGNTFLSGRNSRTCSKSCGTKLSRKKWSTNVKTKAKNKTQRNLGILKNTFNFSKCMIEGCSYNKIYDIHRLIEGKNGGKYIIGNMFAICPNHHAEIHRHISTVEKINDYTLKIKE